MTRPIIRVMDVENGPDPIIEGGNIVDPGIIEIGYYDLVSQRDDLLGNPIDWEVGGSGGSLVFPGRPIPPETSAIHNLIDADVANAPAWGFVARVVFDPAAMDGVIAFAAHNAKHEQSLIGQDLTGGLPWLCTYKAALRLWPEMASHSNASVRYHLNPRGLDRQKAAPQHRAIPDSYVTAHILREALELVSWQDIADWSSRPSLLPRCKIGDWRRADGKGTPWPEVDSGMLHWILSKSFDADTMFTARYHLEQREIDQRLEEERRDLDRQLRENGLLQQATTEAPARDASTLEMDF